MSKAVFRKHLYSPEDVMASLSISQEIYKRILYWAKQNHPTWKFFKPSASRHKFVRYSAVTVDTLSFKFEEGEFPEEPPRRKSEAAREEANA